MHGGLPLEELTTPNPSAVEKGLENLAAHLDSAAQFGKPTIVAVNKFNTDTDAELAVVHDYCKSRNVASATADVFGAGGAGAIQLAEAVVVAADGPETPYQPLYPLEWSAEKKIERIARVMYGADGVSILPAAEAKLRKARKYGYGSLPICMAKTQDSLSDNPKLRGRPKGFTLTVRDVEIAAGAGFLVALTGDIVRMPGLPQRPAAESDHELPQRAIVHVERPLPEHLARVKVGVAEVQPIVDDRGEQVVCGGDRMKIAGELQIDGV
jgi:formate--tetrahydrofolate ligase